MTDEIIFDAIKEDLESIYRMLEKYEIELDTAYETDTRDIKITKHAQQEGLMDDIEELAGSLNMLSNGFDRILVAAREEHERRKVS